MSIRAREFSSGPEYCGIVEKIEFLVVANCFTIRGSKYDTQAAKIV